MVKLNTPLIATPAVINLNYTQIHQHDIRPLAIRCTIDINKFNESILTSATPYNNHITNHLPVIIVYALHFVHLCHPTQNVLWPLGVISIAYFVSK